MHVREPQVAAYYAAGKKTATFIMFPITRPADTKSALFILRNSLIFMKKAHFFSPVKNLRTKKKSMKQLSQSRKRYLFIEQLAKQWVLKQNTCWWQKVVPYCFGWHRVLRANHRPFVFTVGNPHFTNSDRGKQVRSDMCRVQASGKRRSSGQIGNRNVDKYQIKHYKMARYSSNNM